MKTKLPLIAALYCGLCSVGSAFTLDFSGLNVGDTLPQTIFVPGYGSVSFAATNGTLEIKKFAPGAQNAIAFDFAESISITFNNAVPINVTNQYIGVNPGESFAFLPDAIDPKVFSLTMAGASPSGAAVFSRLSSTRFPSQAPRYSERWASLSLSFAVAARPQQNICSIKKRVLPRRTRFLFSIESFAAAGSLQFPRGRG